MESSQVRETSRVCPGPEIRRRLELLPFRFGTPVAGPPFQEGVRSGNQSFGILRGFRGIASIAALRFPMEVNPSRDFRPGSQPISGGGADGNCFSSIPPSRQGGDPFGKVSPVKFHSVKGLFLPRIASLRGLSPECEISLEMARW